MLFTDFHQLLSSFTILSSSNQNDTWSTVYHLSDYMSSIRPSFSFIKTQSYCLFDLTDLSLSHFHSCTCGLYAHTAHGFIAECCLPFSIHVHIYTRPVLARLIYIPVCKVHVPAVNVSIKTISLKESGSNSYSKCFCIAELNETRAHLCWTIVGRLCFFTCCLLSPIHRGIFRVIAASST